jgi:hypothetical protein
VDEHIEAHQAVKEFQAHELLSLVRSINNKASLCFEGKDPRYRLAQVNNFTEALDECFNLCSALDLPMSALHAHQLQVQTVEHPQQLTNRETERMAAMLSVTIENELSLRSFLAVSPDKAKFYEANFEPFGKAVTISFPSTSFDAGEANRCFALNRSTACVFHLMRVLEIGLRVFADRFGVPSDHTNWHNIIEGVEKAVRNMGSDPSRPSDWRHQQEFFSQAANHFMFVKDAWRNYTAHARGKYTDEEAETLIINVRAFMQKLATRLHE